MPPQTSAGKLLRRLRWPVVAAWIVTVVALHPLAGTLYKVTDDSASANLPSGAQSTRVAAFTREASTNDSKRRTHSSIAAVFSRPTGLSARDDAAVATARTAIERLAGRQRGLSAPGGVREAGDGRAAVFAIEVAASPLNTNSVDTAAVAAVRRAIQDSTRHDSGLHAAVTGAAAVTADGGNTSQTSLLVTALIVVGLVLLVVYASVVLWIFPLLGALAGIVVAQASAHALGSAGLTVSSLSTSILIVLAFGLASDYALLLIHRYRDELARAAAPEDAMAVALRRTAPTLIASAATVVCAMLCLLAADSASLRGLGPVGAVTVVGALLAQTTFLPALLLLVGRRAFWPRRPRSGADVQPSRLWTAVGAAVGRNARLTVLGVLVLLGVAAAGLGWLHADDNPLDNLRDRGDSVAAAHVVAAHFGAGADAPLTVLVPDSSAAPAVRVMRTSVQVAMVAAAAPAGELRSYSVTLRVDPYSAAGSSAITTLRHRLARAAPGALVGGDPAIRYDVRRSAGRDASVLIPLILVAIFLVVAVLLQALLAALVLVLATAVSFAASLGAAAALWTQVFGFSGVESQLPIYVFVFMVALGVDYSVFLAARIREEARQHGAGAGISRGLNATGGVITAAGVVLAGTFAALAERPLVGLVEVGTAISLGVLLDTLLVRALLVPALLHLSGARAWWPKPPCVVAQTDLTLTWRQPVG